MNLFFHSPMHLSNFGNNIRSLNCFGMDKAYVYDQFNVAENQADWGKDRHRRYNNFSAGANRFVKIEWVKNPEAFLKQWQGRVIATIAEHPQGHFIWDFSFHPSDLVLIGSESHGLQENILTLCSDFISIPQFGPTHSLNVSAATSVVLYEWARQLHS